MKKEDSSLFSFFSLFFLCFCLFYVFLCLLVVGVHLSDHLLHVGGLWEGLVNLVGVFVPATHVYTVVLINHVVVISLGIHLTQVLEPFEFILAVLVVLGLLRFLRATSLLGSLLGSLLNDLLGATWRLLGLLLNDLLDLLNDLLDRLRLIVRVRDAVLSVRDRQSLLLGLGHARRSRGLLAVLAGDLLLRLLGLLPVLTLFQDVLVRPRLVVAVLGLESRAELGDLRGDREAHVHLYHESTDTLEEDVPRLNALVEGPLGLLVVVALSALVSLLALLSLLALVSLLERGSLELVQEGISGLKLLLELVQHCENTSHLRHLYALRLRVYYGWMNTWLFGRNSFQFFF